MDLRVCNFREKKGLNPKKVEIIKGSGYGICQDEDMFFIKELIASKNRKWKNGILEYYKNLNTYFNSTFLLEENNKLVDDYIALYEEMYIPKSIVMNVSLDGFAKDIKRKIIVNNNISIDSFCRAIITSMRGDMSHLYTIKMNKKYYDENILSEELNYLELTVGKRLKVLYDFGDNWVFNVRVSKIINGYNPKEFEILGGVGYGIVDDCGGVYGLYNVFNDTSEYFKKRDINEFNLDELQKLVDKS